MTFYQEFFRDKYGIAPGMRVHVTQFNGAVDRGLGTVVDVWVGSVSRHPYAKVALDDGTTDGFHLDSQASKVVRVQ